MAVFPQILNMSLSGSVVIVFVLAARLLLKRSPKVISYALWSVVLFRLLCPVTIESPVSAMPNLPQVTVQTVDTVLPEVEFTTPADREQNQISDNVTVGHSASPTVWLGSLWIAGMAGMICWALISCIRLRKQLTGAMHLRDNIWLADHITSPFVLGLFRPRIYLPSGTENTAYILLHEQHHIRRLDHVMKMLAFLALCVHWFNPLVWLAFVLAGRDMEMSCDEAVMKRLGSEIRADYAASLLQLATGRHVFAGTPLAFGEGNTRGRIKNLANWKRPVLWVVIIAAVLCAVLAVCLITDPVQLIRNPWTQEYTPGQGNIRGDVDTEKYLAVSEDFAIGATRYGTAVFKDPQKAFATLQRLYGDSIELIRDAYGLGDFTKNWQDYKVYGMQVTSGSEQELQRTRFVSQFLDIYENSFVKESGAGNGPIVEPTVSLDDTLSAVILAHHESSRSSGRICVESHEILASESREDGAVLTVYLMVLYEEFSPYNDNVSEGGSYVPTAITIDLTSNAVVEYWEPRVGAYHADDVRDKFPGASAAQALQGQDRYIDKLEAENLVKANAQRQNLGDLDEILGGIIEKICSEPAHSSNPGDYIAAHPELYDKLVNYNTYAMQYCFRRFLQGGEIGLEGHIMAQVCRDIMESWHQTPAPGLHMTGQDWFDAFYEETQRLKGAIQEEEFRKHYPASWLLTEMTKK